MKRFNGFKIKEAREARIITAVTLADLVGVSASAISQYESGTKVPLPDTQSKIAVILNLPLTFFYDQQTNNEALRIYFRSLSTATKSARIKEARRFNWHLNISRFVRDFAQLPSVKVPQWDMPENPGHISFDNIEICATELRTLWRLGANPIHNLVELLESNGVILLRCRFENDALDAYSAWADDGPHIILGADKEAAVRSRFDAAHELGHLILHAKVDFKALNQPQLLKIVEQQANYFAGAFLLPEISFSSEFFIPTLDSLLSLKSRWKVSVAAMIMRSLALELISEEQHKRLMIARARRGWTKREPHDDIIPIEQPTLLKDALELGFTHGRISISEVMTRLALAVTDIEQLAGLPYGFLSQSSKAQISLKPSASDEEFNNIIAFPQN